MYIAALGTLCPGLGFGGFLGTVVEVERATVVDVGVHHRPDSLHVEIQIVFPTSLKEKGLGSHRVVSVFETCNCLSVLFGELRLHHKQTSHDAQGP